MCKNAPLHECIDALGSSLLASDTKRVAAIFFPSFNKSCQFIGFKTLEKPSHEGSGSIPDLTSRTDLHRINSLVACMQSRLRRQIRSRPTPHLTRS